MLDKYENLNGFTLIFAWLNEKWLNLTALYEQIRAEKAKRLIDFHRFTAYYTTEKFTRKSKKVHGQNCF